MKKIFLLYFFILGSIHAYSQKDKAIFLVHSTGTNIFSQGKVSEWVKNYNSKNSSNFQITTRTYPNTPWPWENYPYDYWKLWVDGNCNNTDPDIECLPSIAKNYELVIFKHCYPGAGIKADIGKPDINSNRKSSENYKLQYRALRALMDGLPETKFMIWTLVPLHRLATTPENALRAYEFTNWVKNQWLNEDGKNHPNIFIFDFYSLAAELDENPINGKQYCLKYDYEDSHTSDDSHPNLLANTTIGPHFAEAVVKVLSKNNSVTSISVSSQNGGAEINTGIKIFPNPTSDKIQIQIDKVYKEGALIEIRNSTGYLLEKKHVYGSLSEWSLKEYNNNTFFITITTKNKTVTQKIMKF